MKYILLSLITLASSAYAGPGDIGSALMKQDGVIVLEDRREVFDNTIKKHISDDSKLFGTFQKGDSNCGSKLPEQISIAFGYGSNYFSEGMSVQHLCVFAKREMTDGFSVGSYCNVGSSSNSYVGGRDPGSGALWLLPKIYSSSEDNRITNTELYNFSNESGFKTITHIVLNPGNSNQIILRKKQNRNKNANEAAFEETCIYNRK